MEKKKKLTPTSGKLYAENENTMTADAKDAMLSQKAMSPKKAITTNHKPTPERMADEKDTNAYGTFTVTNDISQYTKAKLFNKVAKQTKVCVRFSTVGGEKGNAGTERDPLGFDVKFYTEDGNWDLLGNNSPVFFVKDPKKIPDLIHTQKRDPQTNCKSQTMMWDYWSLNPESLHQVMILMSDRGTPQGYRHMNGYGSHTYSMINEMNEKVWVKFHFKTMQGIKNLTNNEATERKGKDPNFAQRDLMDAIDKKDFPKWSLKIQVMDDEQAKKFLFNPFDVTKIWSHKKFPLIEVGILELNQTHKNYFADIEQSAFAPSHIVDGISYSPDKILKGRLLTYPDIQHYPGVNYEQISKNNYSIGVDTKFYKENSSDFGSNTSEWYERNAEGSNDHFTQPRWLYNKAMNDNDRHHLISNLVVAMNEIKGDKKDLIINRQLCHFFRADMQFGMAVAKGLGVNIEAVIKDFKQVLLNA